MTKPGIKWWINILNAILLSELMSLNYSEICAYEKCIMNWRIFKMFLVYHWKLFKKSETIVSIRTSIPKISEFYRFLIHCSDIFGGKLNIENTSENIKCGNL